MSWLNAYLVAPGQMERVLGSNNEALLQQALGHHNSINDTLFAPASEGVSMADAITELLAGGKLERGLAHQYVYAFETLCAAVGRRLADTNWGDLPMSVIDEIDANLQRAGRTTRLMTVVFNEGANEYQSERGLPIPMEVPVLSQLSSDQAATISNDLEGFIVDEPEDQEAIDGLRDACKQAVAVDGELVLFYS